METVNILGVHVNKYTMNEAVEKAEELMESDSLSMIFTPNSEIILYASNNQEFTDVLNSADMIIPDGIGVVYGAKILKNPIKERVAGFDLVCNLFPKMAEKKQSVFLLGAKPGVALSAAEKLKEKYPGLVIAGTHDGYFKEDEPVVAQIRQSQADLLFVCLGAPRQEKFMARWGKELGVKLAMGLGGSLDVYAGAVERAPES